ncbi:rCG26940 [Rattus norvegicus]|uniref:RCG26940 n=1 Tax=Rattus norvegicus TaxID=10116 RepID=A6HP77_RAT|nr:rCG26940 [Rattus norvegicus]
MDSSLWFWFTFPRSDCALTFKRVLVLGIWDST